MSLRLRPTLVALFALLLCFALFGLAPAALAPVENDFHFTILGDRTGNAQAEVYGRVWREIDLLHPDFIINVGDSIQGEKDATAAAEWADLQEFWKRYARYPHFFTAGNHDIWSPASRRLFEKVTGRKATYSFDWQNAHFTVLDNSQTLELGGEQLAFLEKDLAANKTKSPKFVFFHKPYWIAYLKLKTSDFALHRILTKYRVDTVVSGHGHQLVRMDRDGVMYLEAGSSGASTKGDFAKGGFHHHIWVRVKGPRAEFSVKEVDGAKGGGRMFNLDDWNENGPKFDAADPAAMHKPRT